MVLLGAVVLGIVLVAWLNDQKLFRRVPLDQSPDDLAHTSRDVLRQWGYEDLSADQAQGIAEDAAVLDSLAARDSSPDRWEPLGTGQPAAMYFWYRTSPRTLISSRISGSPRPAGLPGWIRLAEPLMKTPGETAVCLDLKGRLIEFLAVPPPDLPAQTVQEPRWELAFQQAGLDWAQFKDHAVPPRRVPPVFCDSRGAWEWHGADTPDIPLHVEAGILGGRLVYWHVGTDGAPERVRAEPIPPSGEGEATPALDTMIGAIGLIVLFGGALLVRRNLRLGCCNRAGALRLAIFFGTVLIGFLTFIWIAYMAGEPFIRRRWPWQVISWNRLLEGCWRDPLVGRDVLIGILGGAMIASMALVHNRAPSWLGLTPAVPLSLAEEALTHGPYYVLFNLIDALMASLIWFGLLLVLVLLFRRVWLAVGVALVLVAAAAGFTSQYPVLAVCHWMLYFSVILGLMVRAGILSTFACFYSFDILTATPVTTELAAWYAPHGLIPAGALAGLAVVAFFIARGNRPLLARGWLGDE
jgi:serine/threonine-protein kinase